MADHAFLSASGASIWLNCTVSPHLSKKIKDTGSVYAREGTLAHAIGEAILLNDDIEVERLKKDKLFYEGMIDEVEEYSNYCIEQLNAMKVIDPEGASMHIEQRLNLTEWVPDGFGTGDCVIIGDGLLEIIDLKFGKGVVVDVEENPQLMLYALGALHEFGFLYEIKKVRMTIAQVRNGGISSYEMKVDDLMRWAVEVVKPKALEAYLNEGYPKAGEWCTFCKWRFNCKERARYMLELADLYQDKKSLSLEEYGIILKRMKPIEKWLKDIKEYTLNEALSGVRFPGWKLVEGRSIRKVDENKSEEFAEFLLADGFDESAIYAPKKLRGIGDLEKLVGKKKFEELGEGFVIKPPGKPTLAEESDKRKELNGVEEDFDFE